MIRSNVDDQPSMEGTQETTTYGCTGDQPYGVSWLSWFDRRPYIRSISGLTVAETIDTLYIQYRVSMPKRNAERNSVTIRETQFVSEALTQLHEV